MTKQLNDQFARTRKLFPVTDKEKGITYFNSASTGPLSRPVRKALDDYYDLTQYLEKSAIDNDAFAALGNIRKQGAGLIGARPDEVGFGFSTTFGLNIAAFGLPLKKGDEILLSDIEFPANVYPWLALKERGIKVKFIPSTDRCFDIGNFKKAIGTKSKVLALSFVQFFNGYKNNLEEIGRICKERGLYFVVDGIQGCGVEPIDVNKCNIDILSSGAQKWLLSPLGTGFFYVRADLQPKLGFPFASWLSVDWKLNFTDLFHYDLPFFDSARRFEMGTYPYAHVFAMDKALGIIGNLGVKNIQRHNYELLDRLIDYLESDRRYKITSDIETEHRSSILTFGCEKPAELHKALSDKKIICSFRQGSIRISVHLFNNMTEMERLLKILDKF
jgi:cysteine desulfurase/selenocysteine lyase